MTTTSSNGSTSAYKTLGSIRNGVKIWKFQNNTSAIDVTHILNSYKEKIKGENKELVYAGRLCFAITSGGNHLKAYLSKAEAKSLFTMVESGTFSKYYPAGFEKFGGSVKEGKVIAVKLEINVFSKEEDVWNSKTRAKEKRKVTKVDMNIQEMPGERTQTGGYKPIGKATKQVKTIFNASDLLSMAVESMDFIRAAEAKGIADGIPLNTITNYDWEKLPAEKEGGYASPASQPKPEKTHFTDEELQAMEGKEFHALYLKKIEEAKTYQKEYDRRVALKKSRETAPTS